MEEVILPPANQQVKRVKMYAVEDTDYFDKGESTMVDPVNVDYFKAKGFSLTKPSSETSGDNTSVGTGKAETMLGIKDPIAAAALAKK